MKWNQSQHHQFCSFTTAICAVFECVLGASIFAFPQFLLRALFGERLSGRPELLLARIPGMALVVLGVVFWADVIEEGAISIALLQLFFNLFSVGYLAYIKLSGVGETPLMWAFIALHTVMTAMMAWIAYEGASTIGDKRAVPR
jgi:hypothetical protein